MMTPAPRSEMFDGVHDVVVAGHIVLVLGWAYLRLLGVDYLENCRKSVLVELADHVHLG